MYRPIKMKTMRSVDINQPLWLDASSVSLSSTISSASYRSAEIMTDFYCNKPQTSSYPSELDDIKDVEVQHHPTLLYSSSTTGLHHRHHPQSMSPSTCRSDDSGLDRTVNLSPSSPLLGVGADSDSLDELLFDDYVDSPENNLSSFSCSSPPDWLSKSDEFLTASRISTYRRSTAGSSVPSSPPVYGQSHHSISNNRSTANRFGLLSFSQMKRLHDLITKPVAIRSRSQDLPLINLSLFDLLTKLRQVLLEESIPIRDIRLNGGAASYIIGMDECPAYNDIDLLISMDLSTDISLMQRVKTVVLDVISNFMPPPSSTNLESEGPSRLTNDNFLASNDINTIPLDNEVGIEQESSRMPDSQSSQLPSSSNSSLVDRESYIYKQFRKFNASTNDCWSLLSLGVPSTDSKVIELKFVDRMHRQFEFTVDSFQISLDALLNYCNSMHQPVVHAVELEREQPKIENEETHPRPLSPNFYPTVVAESVSGWSYSDAMYHLKNKLIITKAPETIRGGGLLKYCRLLLGGYRTAEGINVPNLERYMCSRFFIDFQDLASQRSKIESFLDNHFQLTDNSGKIDFLRTFYRVVSGSTICLMNHERCQTMQLIQSILHSLLALEASLTVKTPSPAPPAPSVPSSICIDIDSFASKVNLRVESIFLGSSLFHLLPSTCHWQSATSTNNNDNATNSNDDDHKHGRQPSDSVGKKLPQWKGDSESFHDHNNRLSIRVRS